MWQLRRNRRESPPLALKISQRGGSGTIRKFFETIRKFCLTAKYNCCIIIIIIGTGAAEAEKPGTQGGNNEA